jgi:hypothetical protein
MKLKVNRQFLYFFKIWKEPTKTFTEILKNYSTPTILILAGLSGIADYLGSGFGVVNPGKTLPDINTILIISIFIGPLHGIVRLYIWSYLLTWTGSWLKGKGDYQKIRSAVAWSRAPIVLSLMLWIPKINYLQDHLFTNKIAGIIEEPFLRYLLYSLLTIEFTLSIWALLFLFMFLTKAHKLSPFKTLITIFLTMIITALPFVIFGNS